MTVLLLLGWKNICTSQVSMLVTDQFKYIWMNPLHNWGGTSSLSYHYLSLVTILNIIIITGEIFFMMIKAGSRVGKLISYSMIGMFERVHVEMLKCWNEMAHVEMVHVWNDWNIGNQKDSWTFQNYWLMNSLLIGIYFELK